MQALRSLPAGDDAAICADTGSGKTLAYLVPIIAALSEDLMQEDLSNFLSAALRGGQSVKWAREQARVRVRVGLGVGVRVNNPNPNPYPSP